MDRPVSRQHPFPPLLQLGARHRFRFNFGANEPARRNHPARKFERFWEPASSLCPRKSKTSDPVKTRCRVASELRRARQRVAAYMDRPSSRQHPFSRRVQLNGEPSGLQCLQRKRSRGPNMSGSQIRAISGNRYQVLSGEDWKLPEPVRRAVTGPRL